MRLWTAARGGLFGQFWPAHFRSVSKQRKAVAAGIGLIIAVLAVVLAVIGSLGRDAANQMIVNEVKASNGFAWYQSKRQRAVIRVTPG